MAATPPATGRASRVLVVGAGAGTFAALSLAEAGADVTIVDRATGFLTGASGRNGRRLHLGEHYSADLVPASDQCTLNTGRLCFLGAVQLARRFPFVRPSTSAWWQLLPSDSMTLPQDYEQHLKSLRSFHDYLARLDPSIDQLFGPASERHRKLDPFMLGRYLPAQSLLAGYESRENVIDLGRLRRNLMASLRQCSSNVRIVLQTTVLGIERLASGYRATFNPAVGRIYNAKYDIIVNASWHEIPTLARMISNDYVPTGTVRLKVLVSGRLPQDLRNVPSFYFHRGVYGNHTNTGNGLAIITAEKISNLSFAHYSQIPLYWQTLISQGLAGRPGLDALTAVALAPDNPAGSTGDDLRHKALTAVIHAAKAFDSDHRFAAAESRRMLAAAVVGNYSDLVPAFRTVEATDIKFTTVVSSGSADLADPTSPVHTRAFAVEEVAPGFYNFNPGKLTLAQLAAQYLRIIALPAGPSNMSALDHNVFDLLQSMTKASPLTRRKHEWA